jgi:hypothetical protein
MTTVIVALPNVDGRFQAIVLLALGRPQATPIMIIAMLNAMLDATLDTMLDIMQDAMQDEVETGATAEIVERPVNAVMSTITANVDHRARVAVRQVRVAT